VKNIPKLVRYAGALAEKDCQNLLLEFRFKKPAAKTIAKITTDIDCRLSTTKFIKILEDDNNI
jgi:hypothetical protein